MTKEKRFQNTKFSKEAVQQAWDKMASYLSEYDKNLIRISLSVHLGSEKWEHDTEPEFFSDYLKDSTFAYYLKSTDLQKHMIKIIYSRPHSNVSITMPERSMVEEIHQIFDSFAPNCALPEGITPTEKNPIVFIGHGQSKQWRDLKDHLHDKHGYEIEAYEVGARSGHAIRDIIDEMLYKSSFAIIIMTGEDKDEHGNLHARENVIHELGLFQGKLGFPRAIILLEQGTSEFSNIHGIEQLRYSKNNIKEIFGDVIATLKREFE